jgi:hypothetical protein
MLSFKGKTVIYIYMCKNEILHESIILTVLSILANTREI